MIRGKQVNFDWSNISKLIVTDDKGKVRELVDVTFIPATQNEVSKLEFDTNIELKNGKKLTNGKGFVKFSNPLTESDSITMGINDTPNIQFHADMDELNVSHSRYLNIGIDSLLGSLVEDIDLTQYNLTGTANVYVGSGEIIIGKNDQHLISNSDDKQSVIISSKDSVILPNVVNSLVAGGSNIIVSENNTLYTENLSVEGLILKKLAYRDAVVIEDDNDIPNKLYTDNASLQSSSNINMLANVTNNDGDVATSTVILEQPIDGTPVYVYINGEKMDCSYDEQNDTVGDCVFSSPNIFELRNNSNVQQGDVLLWYGSNAGFELEETDVIDFVYQTNKNL